jgi:HK97 gp10 family phage protein
MADDGGIGRLSRRLAAISGAVKEAVQPVLLKQARTMATDMERFAPVDTGDLRDSIRVTPAGQSTPPYSQPGGTKVVPENAVAITVGGEEVRYPHLVEYGTQDTPAQPFFWPAVRLNRKKAQRAIKAGIGRAVRKAGKS